MSLSLSEQVIERYTTDHEHISVVVHGDQHEQVCNSELHSEEEGTNALLAQGGSHFDPMKYSRQLGEEFSGWERTREAYRVPLTCYHRRDHVHERHEREPS